MSGVKNFKYPSGGTLSIHKVNDRHVVTAWNTKGKSMSIIGAFTTERQATQAVRDMIAADKAVTKSGSYSLPRKKVAKKPAKKAAKKR